LVKHRAFSRKQEAHQQRLDLTQAITSLSEKNMALLRMGKDVHFENAEEEEIASHSLSSRQHPEAVEVERSRRFLSASNEHCKADASRHKHYGDPEQRKKASTVAAFLKSRL